MADKKISELTELTSPDGTEELVVNDSGVSKKIDINNLYAGSSSKLGIGTTDPQADLHVVSSASQSPVIKLENDTSSGADPRLIICDSVENYGYSVGVDDSGNKFTISYDGSGTNPVSGTNDRLVIDSNGNVDLANGISFGGDTTSGDSRYLDDYEEGDWTPLIGGGQEGRSISTASGTYVKVGKVVCIKYYFVSSGFPLDSGTSISGVPYDCEDAFSLTSVESTGIAWGNNSMLPIYVSQSQQLVFPLNKEIYGSASANDTYRGSITYIST